MELAACKSSRTTVMSSQLYIQSTLYVYAYGVFGEGKKKYVMLPDILWSNPNKKPLLLLSFFYYDY